MNHDDERLELLSAYLDGEATPDERARVDADTELLAEVDRLRQLRAQIAGVEAPTAEARESAIAAALTAFDESGGGVQTAAAPSVVSIEQRRRARWMRSITAAAAAAVVVVVGFVVANRGDDTPTAMVREDAAMMSTAPADGDDATAQRELPRAPAPAAAAPATLSLGAVPAPAELDEEAALDLTMDAAEPGLTEARDLPMIDDADGLRALAESIDPEPSPWDDLEADCVDGDLAADAVFVDDGVDHIVAVAALDGGGWAAVDLATCEVVLEVLAR